MLELLIKDVSGRLTVYPLTPGHTLSLGRGANCTIVLDDELVSQQHLTVKAEAQGIHLVDSSRNGTFVGAKLLHNAEVDAPLGTLMRLGRTLMTIRPAKPHSKPAPSSRPSKPPASNEVDSSAGSVVPFAPPSPRTVPPNTPSVEAEKPLPPRAARGAATQLGSLNLELRRQIHRELLQHLDLGKQDISAMDVAALRPRVVQALKLIVSSMKDRLEPGTDLKRLLGDLTDEALGLGPLEELLADPEVSEIMVVDAQTIYAEKAGRVTLTDACFTDDARVRAVIERIITPLGRRIDESVPLVDARLKDGSRVNAIIRPLALRGSCITIRKFPKRQLRLDDLRSFGSLDESMQRLLTRSVQAKKNIIVSGGTGSGKTTLLNALSAAIPSAERIITIEDSAELQLAQPHVVSLETRPPNLENKGAYTIRDLVKNALRMRPDRIVVGECRGGEALDMLQAMNTGHEGSLTTIHSNSTTEALSRLETLCLMAGLDLPARSIREQIASSVHLIVQQQRLHDGSRKVVAISEVAGIDPKGRIKERILHQFAQTGTDADGRCLGEFRATGYLPSFLEEFIVLGLIRPGESYL